MKFLPEFALCWGGATITPTAINAAIPDEERNSGEVTTPSAIRSGRERRIVKSRNGANWKPALRVIAEERVMSDIVVDGNGRGRKERAVVPPSSCAKSAAKVKAKSIARSKLSSRHGDDYWKSAGPMAVPAFAPTAFLF
ncbi:hypothetical protein MTR67_032475 [Solanum verrucosum]|uniref:Uncharacterized protein n=2 Tax=Solanum TaxID=4107 RepID=A0A9J5Y9Z0_SOLCO|nr:uncharacterized protein LOC125817454 [Solanum verrucosum]KAG5596930.1 hypothetical protein H5410_038162 [Solanum commersonii]WMV39090.1 hypothetical protein MTR67_032475 [Solanum verrucosum]